MEFIFSLQRFTALNLAGDFTFDPTSGLPEGTKTIYVAQTTGALSSAGVGKTASSAAVILTGSVGTTGTYKASEFPTVEVKDGASLTEGVVLSDSTSLTVKGTGLSATTLMVGSSANNHFSVTGTTTIDNGVITAAPGLSITSGSVSIKGNVNSTVLSTGTDGKAVYVANTALNGVTVTTSAGVAAITESSNVAATEVSTSGDVITINGVDKGGVVKVSTVAGTTSSVVVDGDTFGVGTDGGTLNVYKGDHAYLTGGAVVVNSTQHAATSGTIYVSSGTNETKTSLVHLVSANASSEISLNVSNGAYTVTGLSSGDVVAIDGTEYTYNQTENVFTAGGKTYILESTGTALKGTIAGGTAATDTADTLNIVQGTDLGQVFTKTAGASSHIYGNESKALHQYESAGKIFTTSTKSASNGTYLNSVSYDSKSGKYKFDATDSTVGQDLDTATGLVFASVIGGKGADSIQADLGGQSDGFVISSGAGADNVTMAGGVAFGSDWKIATGAGKDTIALDGALTNAVTGWVVDGGEDDDLITVGTAANTQIQQSSIVGGAGKDTITNFGTDNTLTGGAGADTFDISAAGALANISDYKLGEDLIQVSVDPTTALTSAMFSTDGTITDAGTATITGSGFYAAQLTNGTTKQYVGWVGENATKIDGSTMADSVVLYGTQNDAGDLLLGGAKKDTVYAGAGDSVYGGAGNDSVVVNGAGVYVGVATNSGADTVSGFVTGFDTETADQLYMVNGSVSQVTIANNGNGDIKFSDGSGSVSLSGATGTGTGYASLLVSGKKVYSIEDNATLTVDDSTELADYYFGTKGTTGKGSAVDLSGFTSVLNVNLSDTNVYHNITSVKGGASTTSLIGSAGAESLAGGDGVASLWGGNGGKDTLVSGTASTEFFFASGNGNDVVEGFKNTDGAADTLNFFGGDFASVARTGDQEVKVSVSDGSTLTVGTADSGADTKLTWKSGAASGVAKVGSIAGANSFTYESGVTNYIGGNKQDVLTVNDDAGNVNVWLDGSQGVSYSSIDVMDATSNTGNIQLAGDSASQSIVGGQGNTSLWGGVGSAADTLVGGSGVNEFFYLMGNGSDVISGNATDTVNLLDIKLSDITAANIDTSSNRVIFTTTANETVTVSGSVQNFKLGDGSAWVADYTGENGSWSAKN